MRILTPPTLILIKIIALQFMGCTKIKSKPQEIPNIALPAVDPPNPQQESEYESKNEEEIQPSILDELKAAPLLHQMIPPSFPESELKKCHESNEAVFSDLSQSIDDKVVLDGESNNKKKKEHKQ